MRGDAARHPTMSPRAPCVPGIGVNFSLSSTRLANTCPGRASLTPTQLTLCALWLAGAFGREGKRWDAYTTTQGVITPAVISEGTERSPSESQVQGDGLAPHPCSSCGGHCGGQGFDTPPDTSGGGGAARLKWQQRNQQRARVVRGRPTDPQPGCVAEGKAKQEPASTQSRARPFLAAGAVTARPGVLQEQRTDTAGSVQSAERYSAVKPNEPARVTEGPAVHADEREAGL